MKSMMIAVIMACGMNAVADQSSVTIGKGRYNVTVKETSERTMSVLVNGVVVFEDIGKYSAQQLTTAIRSVGGQLANPPSIKVRE